MPQPDVLLQYGCLIALAGLLLAAACQDLRSLRIANHFPIAVAALFVVWTALGWRDGSVSPASTGLALACAIGLFGIGAAAFAAGMMGGGDVKLLAGLGLFAGPDLVLDLLLITALGGGILGLAAMAGAPLGAVPVPAEATLRTRLRTRVPYGPAIALGGLWVATALAVG